MKKYVKIILIGALCLVFAVFINGCYYVFCHQDKSMAKKLRAAVEYLSDKQSGASVHVAWKASKDYALYSHEHRAAIAVNASDVIKGEVDKTTGDYEIRIRCAMVYPKYSRTEFNLGKFSIWIQEGLFRYLEERGWISRYIAEYYTIIRKQ